MKLVKIILMASVLSTFQSSYAQNTVCRIWHGWTTIENAPALKKIFLEEALPSIRQRNIPGLRDVQVLSREVGGEVEFTTFMWFDSIEAVKQFAGEEYEKAHIDPAVAPLLLRYDTEVRHSTVLN
jgi:hypothetical protein